MTKEHIDMKPHVATYDRVTKLFFYGAITVIVIAFAVIWLIAG